MKDYDRENYDVKESTIAQLWEGIDCSHDVAEQIAIRDQIIERQQAEVAHYKSMEAGRADELAESKKRAAAYRGIAKMGKPRGSSKMTRYNRTERALQLALDVHGGQKDKGGHPYIEHVIRVGMAQKTEFGRVVGILHDVKEDGTPAQWDRLVSEFGQEVAGAVSRLSREKGQEYGHYILGISECLVCIDVKLADLRDNMDLSRLSDPTTIDAARVLKYARAGAILRNKKPSQE